ncbi:uncharacterized protein M6B38_267225 [Iris pallida]|uniref:Uncharacterized protein n=1 Tax=Iris pallida TaxID=29817 RepID=A0AAX6IAA0_IRIPA|nr:uncharacterized protein M6B38_360505 [Iris pallida]KAJ6849863.1 uncharacterized protein M6B38_267225 [Iris pallida]
MDDAADDGESWAAAAAAHPELAAHQIARFRNPCWDPAWRDLVPTPAPAVSVSVDWGSRRRRSGTGAGPRRIRIRYPKPYSGGAAASPATPLDFGSGSGSACGSEEASSSLEKKANPVAASNDVSGSGCVAKVGVIYRLPLGSAKDIRRSGKKKTICELQDEEKMLLEEKIMLEKEVELGRKAYKALQVENKRLKMRQLNLLSERVPTTMAANVVSSGQCSSSQFLLPDLNEPLPDNLG